jgi:hypothetical protein
VRGTFVGLGGAGRSAILAGACCDRHVGRLWLDLWDGVEGWVLYTLGDGGVGLSGWVMSLVLIKGLGVAFVLMEMLVELSGWHRQGCL